jgi:hypothetical protein
MTTKRPKMPPTDAQIIAEFIKEVRTDSGPLSSGAITARRELATRLKLARIERAEYAKEMGERVSAAFTDAGKKIAAALVKFNADTDKETGS